MSLKIYQNREEIPEGIRVVDVNDSWFNQYTKLRDIEKVKQILWSVDEARRADDTHFYPKIDPDGKIPKMFLSTGCKTALNVLSQPDICFNVIECGDNALTEILRLQNGCVLWEIVSVAYLCDDESVDVIIEDMHFTEASSAIEYLYKGWVYPEEYEVVEDIRKPSSERD